jgi:hypothetical protein
MKRKVVGLFCIALLVSGGVLGCATINPCAPLIDTPIILENFMIDTVAYQIKIHDTDGDGIGDTLAVYVQKQGSYELMEHFQRPLTEAEVARANEVIKEQEVNSQ